MESKLPFLSPLAVDECENNFSLPSLLNQRQSSSPPLGQSIEAVEAESEERVTSEDFENPLQGHGVHLLLASLFGQRVSSSVFSITVQMLTDECDREYIDAFLWRKFGCMSRTISAFQHDTRSKFVLDDRWTRFTQRFLWPEGKGKRTSKISQAISRQRWFVFLPECPWPNALENGAQQAIVRRTGPRKTHGTWNSRFRIRRWNSTVYAAHVGFSAKEAWIYTWTLTHHSRWASVNYVGGMCWCSWYLENAFIYSNLYVPEASGKQIKRLWNCRWLFATPRLSA